MLLVLAACSDPVIPGSSKFAEVPAKDSGLDFVHAIPGLLDNTSKAAMGGLALIDFDADGKIDVYFPNGGWDDRLAPNAPRPAEPARAKLFRNLGGMKFEDVTPKAGVGFEGAAFGACVGDYDGDGHADLFVPAYGMPALYRNRGDGTFEEKAKDAGLVPGFYAGATFLDYDRDGVLDLFASQYIDVADVDVALNHAGDFAPPTAYQPQPSRLWRGLGDGTFEDVSAKARIITPGKGMGVLATDADGDGWIDVYVANDGMPNFLWRNQGDGTFADAAVRFGMAYGSDGEARASMGVTAADLNGDGRLDYLTPDTRGGSVLVQRDRYFTDRAKDWAFAAITFDFIGWTDVAFDAENDGRIDVWKVHGDLKRATLSDGQYPKLASNRGRLANGQPSFVYEGHEQSPTAESLEAAAEVRITGRGAVACDFDDDGREDLLAVDLLGAARLIRNITAKPGRWVKIRLAGKAKNTMALGARLTARAGKQKVVREMSGATGYISAPDPRFHIGLGAADSLDDIVIRWPDGHEQKVGSLDAGKLHVIEER